MPMESIAEERLPCLPTYPPGACENRGEHVYNCARLWKNKEDGVARIAPGQPYGRVEAIYGYHFSQRQSAMNYPQNSLTYLSYLHTRHPPGHTDGMDLYEKR